MGHWPNDSGITMGVWINVEATFECRTTGMQGLDCMVRLLPRRREQDFGPLLTEANSMLWQLQKAIFLDQA